MAKKANILHGRQIAKFKAEGIEANPEGSDEEIARALNAKAEKAGLTTQTGKPISFSPDDIKAARPGGSKPPPAKPGRKPGRPPNVAAPAPTKVARVAGTPFMDQLSGLVGVIGKDGVKKLVDGL